MITMVGYITQIQIERKEKLKKKSTKDKKIPI